MRQVTFITLSLCLHEQEFHMLYPIIHIICWDWKFCTQSLISITLISVAHFSFVSSRLYLFLWQFGSLHLGADFSSHLDHVSSLLTPQIHHWLHPLKSVQFLWPLWSHPGVYCPRSTSAFQVCSFHLPLPERQPLPRPWHPILSPRTWTRATCTPFRAPH